MIEAGTANPFTLFALALLLGGLHGLEPGHSKTLMAAYIVAIRGKVADAVLLGVSAAISHSIVVWVLAGLAIWGGRELIGEELEPWLVLTSGVIVIVIGVWMAVSLARRSRRRVHHHHQHHGHGGDEDHHHHHDHDHDHNQDHGGGGGGHGRGPHRAAALAARDAGLDAHAAAHAAEIEARLARGGPVTRIQTILFGLSGGLIPCPAAITVLLLCLRLEQPALGLVLVSAFSLGLALTLVTVGAAAALGMRYVAARAPWIDKALDKAPYASAALVTLIGVAMIWLGISELSNH